MTEWALGRCWESSGGTVRYEVFGDGPPVVLVHGTPSSTYLWRRIIPALADVRTVYAYDLLGYGQSEKRDGHDVSLGAQTRLLAQLLDYWKLEEPAIVGHDFGGAITLRTHLLERRPFSAIALLDPVALGPWGTPFFQLVRDNVGVFQQIPATIHRAIVAAYLRGAFHLPMSEEALAPYVDPWLGPAGQDAFYRQIAQADQRFTDEVEGLYGEIRAPFLILWGEEDGMDSGADSPSPPNAHSGVRAAADPRGRTLSPRGRTRSRHWSSRSIPLVAARDVPRSRVVEALPVALVTDCY